MMTDFKIIWITRGMKSFTLGSIYEVIDNLVIDDNGEERSFDELQQVFKDDFRYCSKGMVNNATT